MRPHTTTRLYWGLTIFFSLVMIADGIAGRSDGAVGMPLSIINCCARPITQVQCCISSSVGSFVSSAMIALLRTTLAALVIPTIARMPYGGASSH